jgi:8-oxo-dGTP diphosphatase
MTGPEEVATTISTSWDASTTCMISSKFERALPLSRLGKRLSSLQEFQQITSTNNADTRRTVKEYAIVVVSNAEKRRMLLGLKHRGFGKGMYNSFGGKREPAESMDMCACRELLEEAGIAISLTIMAQCRVGTMHYTFDDSDTEMLVDIYHVDIHCSQEYYEGSTVSYNLSTCIDPTVIRGCEEITPEFFSYPKDIPLDNMFADDSLWLPPLLTAYFDNQQLRLQIDGWFHFLADAQNVNSIHHYYIDMRNKRGGVDSINDNNSLPKISATTRYSLEKRLFHNLCCDKKHSVSIKEFKEAWAFANAVRSVFGKNYPFDVIVDVAGGHGALAALLLILTPAKRAIVIDPAHVGKGAVETAWRRDFLNSKELHYRHEDLRTGLPAELKHSLRSTDRQKVLVVACHACQHLSNEVLEIVCCRFPGVHVAVMACCQKDILDNNWKDVSKNLNIKFEVVMDLLLVGKIMGSQQLKEAGFETDIRYDYSVRMKMIDASITPQNRVIVAKSIKFENGTPTANTAKVEAAHLKLASTYERAHRLPRLGRGSKSGYFSPLNNFLDRSQAIGVVGVVLGFTAGFWVASISRKR